MRRPSLGQNEGDLSRLTSVLSTSTPIDSSLSPSSQSTDHNNAPPNNNNNNNNNSNAEIIASTYLPKIIELEWQQHQQNRKRKERQDSTSSSSQDRKLVRSNSEENLLITGENQEKSIRRVVSQEDFKKPLPLSENGKAELQQISENHLVAEEVVLGDENNNQLLHKGYTNSPVKSNRVSPSRDQKNSHNHHRRNEEHLSDGEHERRRSSERFSRTRAPPGRKSASSSKKSSSNNKHYKIRYNVGPLIGGNERDENTYKYDLVSLKCERRGFVSRESKHRSSTKSREDKSENKHRSEIIENVMESGENLPVKSPRIRSHKDPLPWNEFPDETPVICPRFADNTFDHVIGSEKFHSTKTESSGIKYTNNENSKTRDIMKKYSANSMNNNNGWTKNKNNGDLRLMIITPDERMKQINSRLTKLKRRILQYEENFEKDFGCKPARVDTLNDKAMKTIRLEIQKLKKEKQVIKTSGENSTVVTPFSNMMASSIKEAAGTANWDDMGHNLIGHNTTELPCGDLKLSKMQETLTDIEMVLQERRKEESRVEMLEELTMDQLMEEKTSVQRGLLYFESLFGRPGTKEERDLARPLYDRYRQIKRMVNRNSSMNASILVELPTILENEAMAFTTQTPSTEVSPPNSNLVSSANESPPSTDDTSSSINDNLHNLSITELWQQLDVVRDEKKELRRSIKEIEAQFEDENGRKMLKSDRKGSMEETYSLYKQKKGKLRLLDALVKKHMAY